MDVERRRRRELFAPKGAKLRFAPACAAISHGAAFSAFAVE